MSTACQKDFAITVNPTSCVDWALLSWTTIGLVGAATFTPNNAAGAAFDMQIPIAGGVALTTAVVSRNNAGCAANLHLVIDKSGVQQAGMVVSIVPAGIGLSIDFNALAPGAYDFPFLVTDTLGASANISVTVSGVIPSPFPAPGDFISVQGTFS